MMNKMLKKWRLKDKMNSKCKLKMSHNKLNNNQNNKKSSSNNEKNKQKVYFFSFLYFFKFFLSTK